MAVEHNFTFKKLKQWYGMRYLIQKDDVIMKAGEEQ